MGRAQKKFALGKRRSENGTAHGAVHSIGGQKDDDALDVFSGGGSAMKERGRTEAA